MSKAQTGQQAEEEEEEEEEAGFSHSSWTGHVQLKDPQTALRRMYRQH